MVKFEYGDERKDKIVCQNAILYNLRLIFGNDRVSKKRWIYCRTEKGWII